MYQEFDTLDDCACSTICSKKAAYKLAKMEFQDQFVIVNVENISTLVFKKENQ